MFNFKNTQQITALDTAISDLLEALDGMTGSDEDYTKTVNNLDKLMKMKQDVIKIENDYSLETEKVDNDKDKIAIDRDKISLEKEKIEIDRLKLLMDDKNLELEKEKLTHEIEKTRSWKPSTDAIITAAASVVGIVLILHYEKLNVVTSKAVNFVGKMK